MQSPPQQDSMNLYALAQLLRQRVWWLVGCLALTIGLGVVYLLQAEPVYRVHARILVEQKGLASAQARPDRDKDFLATQAEIIRSPAVVSHAVETLGLTATSPDDPNSVVGILESLSVNPLLGTNVLSVSLEGADAGRATRIVETVIESYREYIRESERDVHLEALRALTASEKEVRKDLQELEAEYRELRQNSPLVGRGEEGVRLQRELLAHLGQTLSDVKSRRMELENRLVALEGLRERNLASGEATRVIPVSTAGAEQGDDLRDSRREPAPSSLYVGTSRQLLLQYAKGEAGDIAHLQEQLFAAQARESELSEKYGPKHAAVRGVREQIAGWEAQLREQQASAPLVLQQELEAARLQEQQLADLYREEFAAAKGINNWLLQEQQGLGHIERTREVHDSLLTQIRQWQMVDQALTQGKTEIAVRVLEEPSLDEEQVWPPKLLVLGACALVGLMGGLGLIVSLGNPVRPAFADPTILNHTEEGATESAARQPSPA